MPASENFNNTYRLDSGNSLYGVNYGPSNVEDRFDSQDDNQTSPGGSLYFSFSYYGNSTLEGTTSNGIVVVDGPYRYLLTNSNYTGSETISVNTTDPYVYCFLEGTMITTPFGEREVETLKIGDAVATSDGRTVTVKWMGYQTVHNRIGVSQHREPVKISAHALGEGLPNRDLYLTGSHAVLIDGLLVNASVLCNGDTIKHVPLKDMPETFTYWHIETQEHDAVLANGLASETFVDAPDRRSFDNYNEYISLFGVERIIPEMSVPRATAVSHLPEKLKEKLGIKENRTDWESVMNEENVSLILKQNIA